MSTLNAVKRVSSPEPKRWDVFICHVSEDENYIIQLKEAFVREKIDVFFAKDELSWGCELHRVINVSPRQLSYFLYHIDASTGGEEL